MRLVSSISRRPGRRHNLFFLLSPPSPLVPRSHHDGLFRVRVFFFIFIFPCLDPFPLFSSLAFSTLADPYSWATPSPLDSSDPLDVFDSILYPTFEREIVSDPYSLSRIRSLTIPVDVSVLQLYLLRAPYPRPARTARPFRGFTRRVCTCAPRRADLLLFGRLVSRRLAQSSQLSATTLITRRIVPTYTESLSTNAGQRVGFGNFSYKFGRSAQSTGHIGSRAYAGANRVDSPKRANCSLTISINDTTGTVWWTQARRTTWTSWPISVT